MGIKGNPTEDKAKFSKYQKYLETEVLGFETNKSVVTDDFAPIGN